MLVHKATLCTFWSNTIHRALLRHLLRFQYPCCNSLSIAPSLVSGMFSIWLNAMLYKLCVNERFLMHPVCCRDWEGRYDDDYETRRVNDRVCDDVDSVMTINFVRFATAVLWSACSAECCPFRLIPSKYLSFVMQVDTCTMYVLLLILSSLDICVMYLWGYGTRQAVNVNVGTRLSQLYDM